MSVTGDTLPLVLIGAGGHAKVVHALALQAGRRFAGVCDPQLAAAGALSWRGIAVLGGDEALAAIDPASVGLANGIGQLPGKQLRASVYRALRQAGFHFPVLVHPSATVDPTVRLADGVQVMAGAVIQADSVVGENSVVNTASSVDHDCVLGPDVHIAPGATLCGNVVTGAHAFVGAGATVLPGLSIGSGAVVGAGLCLRRALPDHAIYTGPQGSPDYKLKMQTND